MPRIRIKSENYSTFTDHNTGLQFTPLLDQQTQSYVGIGEATEEQAEAFIGRPGFIFLSDAEYLALATKPEKPDAPTTGDPLTDAAAANAEPLTADGLGRMAWPDVQTLAKGRGVDLRANKTRADVTAALLEAQETPANPLAGAPQPPSGEGDKSDKSDKGEQAEGE